MATYKPLRIGDATRGETTPIRTFAEGDTIDPAFLPGGGGAASIVEITYADMATALAGATLTPGQYYNITDAAGTDLGFVCLAVQADEITVSGIGGFTLTGGNEWDVCEFDFANNQLIYRSDLRGNIVRGADGVAQFPWGNDNVTGNFVLNGIINLTINAAATYANNTVYPGATISDITAGDGTAIENNILENGAQLTGITAGANCQISRNKVGQGATLGGSTTMGDGAEISNNNIIGGIRRNNLSAETSISGNNNGGNINDNTILSGGISSNNIETDGSISENTVTQGSIELCKLFSGSSISGNTFENDGFLGITIYPNKSFSNNTVDGVGVFECIISNNIDGKTFAIEQAGKVSQSGISTFAETIGITGLTTLDCLAENNYVGIFTTASSNATETINQIDNAPTVFPIQIRPAAGLVLTVTGTAYAGIAAGQIALTTTDVTLDGDKGEYLELEIDPLGTGALIERRRVAGIL